jgi:hypothetical protein
LFLLCSSSDRKPARVGSSLQQRKSTVGGGESRVTSLANDGLPPLAITQIKGNINANAYSAPGARRRPTAE